MTEFAYRTATELLGLLGKGEVSSKELLIGYLERIERFNPDINAIVALQPDYALAEAERADARRARGQPRGPLEGLPITIKDTIEVAGMPTTAGAAKLREHMPDTDAQVVRQLKAAGAIVFGKSNTPLYAGDFQTYNEVYGTTNNPWDLTRTPGGSSGGSAAALAAGFTALEIGSDIGGSVRNPAHYSGVFAHRPSYGTISPRGHIPGPPGTQSRADLNMIGPLTRGAGDLALALEVMAGADQWDATAWRLELPAPRHQRLEDYRIALWLDEPLCPVDEPVRNCIRSAFEPLSARCAEFSLSARPDFDPHAHLSLYLRLLYGVMGTGFPPAVFADHVEQAEQLEEDDASFRADMLRGTVQRHRQWLSSNERRARLRAVWARFFEDFDVLITPVMPTTAFPHDHSDIQSRKVNLSGQSLPYLQQVFWASLAVSPYLPATVVPVGLVEGLPVGMQIIGPYLEDRTTIGLARLLEIELGGFRPPPDYSG